MVADYVVLTPETMDLKLFSFGEAKTNNYGGKAIPVKYDGKRFYLKLRGRTPFGVNPTMQGDGYTLQIAVSDPKIQDKLSGLDDMVLQQGIVNKIAWGIPKPKAPSRPGQTAQKFDDEYVQTQHKPLLKYPMKSENKGTPDEVREIDDRYPPYVQVSLPQSQSKTTGEVVFTCEFFNADSDPIRDIGIIPPEERSKGRSVARAIPNMSEVGVLLYANSAWTGAQGYGLSFKVAQAKVYPPQTLPKGQCLIGDDEDDDDSSEGHGLPQGVNMLDDQESMVPVSEPSTTEPSVAEPSTVETRRPRVRIRPN